MLVIRPNAIMKVLEETGNAEEVEFYLLDPGARIIAANSGAEVLEREQRAIPIWSGKYGVARVSG